jgi:hypothetical protein
MIVFQDSSTGTVAGIGDRRIIDGFVNFLSARLNGEARFPLVLKALRDSGEIGVDRIDEAVLEARSIDRILGNATSYGMEEVRSLKAEESGDFVWKELLRVMELTATYRAGSFQVRELGFWPLLDDLGNKRRSKRRG